jgi:hypothetical protein
MKNITLNFGVIRDTISRISANQIIAENKSNTLKDFLTTIKKNPVLFKQSLVFKNFEQCKPFTKERLAERFINQNLSLLNTVSWKNIVEENKKIKNTILEGVHIESNGSKNNELFNNINTLIEAKTNPGFSNINLEQEAYEFVLNYLTRENLNENTSQEVSDNPPLNNWKYITKLAVNNFNERFSHLNEEEKKIVSMLISESDKKRNYIEDLKQENLNMINKYLNEIEDEDKIKLLEGFKNKLEKPYTFDTFTANDFIISYSELNDQLKNL